MKKNRGKDIGTSVRARLLQHARERGEDFQLVLTRYANERLLFRLASSVHAERFVLKGAFLFVLWTGKPHRATRDLDLLGFGESGEAHIRDVFAEVLELDVADDGVRFDLDTLTVGLIREEQEYGGVHVEVIARVTTAQVRLRVDVGFGDSITPEATVVDFPALLDFPAPRLLAYPRETVVAEKLEAMVRLGMANSRMKDFYDIAVLARDFDFDGDVLVRAIRATFERRQTPLPAEVLVAPFRGESPERRLMITILIEHQSEPDLLMPLRMVDYVVQLSYLYAFVYHEREECEKQPLLDRIEAAAWSVDHRQELNQMGKTIAEALRDEGRAEGHVKGLRATLRRQLTRRFGEIPADLVAIIKSTADLEQLMAWLDRFATAERLEDVGIHN